MITVIAPHARPEFSANLLENFRRQRGVEARLLVVENGAAKLHFNSDAAWRVTVCHQQHQAASMNHGLACLRAAGDGPWARFDDDDYYGPDYLAEVVRGLEEHPVVGKTWGFVLFDDGMYRFHHPESGPAEKLTGGTLAARSSAVPPFQPRPDDDLQWCRDLRALGVTLWASDHRGYCYDRRSSRGGAPRVITSGPLVTRWGFGPAEFHGQVGPEYVDAPAATAPHAPAIDAEALMAEMGSASEQRGAVYELSAMRS